MKKILVLSVGGSAEPIVKAIRNYKPDFVYFFCSSKPKGREVTIDSLGDPCGDASSTNIRPERRSFRCFFAGFSTGAYYRCA
jgi:hypothetical protein